MKAILNETSKPQLYILSNISAYIKHTQLKIILNIAKSILKNVPKFHYHKLTTPCSNDRLYKGSITFHFHKKAGILTHRSISRITATFMEKSGVLNGHY